MNDLESEYVHKQHEQYKNEFDAYRRNFAKKAQKWKCVTAQTPLRTIIVFLVDKVDEPDYPFKNGDRLLFMGEIENMRGHCIIVDQHGKTFWGYHTDNFRIIPKEDM